MLEKIKSPYILKYIFLYIEEKTKLKIAKYNKDMQTKLDLNVINYKLFNPKYFIGDKNGKGKEYDYNDNLIFEGEYKNGKRNGKGKEYYSNGKIKFEGEYLNGEKNGKGKKYDFI